MRILITGVAGFIGMHVAKRLLDDDFSVLGIDNFNDYYDVKLKRARVRQLEKFEKFTLKETDIADEVSVSRMVLDFHPKIIIHLAAQAGVRYSIKNPDAYVKTNLVGFANILEVARKLAVDHFLYASSSSVYGLNGKLPFSEEQNVDHPLALYGATKKSNELLAHSYSHLFELPATGLRFFTVYGPWGRPDMALFKFTEAILRGSSIDVFNRGEMIRDFTYIDDVVESIARLMKTPPLGDSNYDTKKPDPARSNAPWVVYNIGNGNPIHLKEYIKSIEIALGKKAKLNLLEMQPGDVVATSANTSRLSAAIGFKPDTKVSAGIKEFVEWYLSYYNVRT